MQMLQNKMKAKFSKRYCFLSRAQWLTFPSSSNHSIYGKKPLMQNLAEEFVPQGMLSVHRKTHWVRHLMLNPCQSLQLRHPPFVDRNVRCLIKLLHMFPLKEVNGAWYYSLYKTELGESCTKENHRTTQPTLIS